MAYAHDQLARAWQQSIVLYTGTPQVEDVKYIETKTQMIDTKTVNMYRSRVMTTLGVNFLNVESDQSVTTAGLSLNQLLLTINKISEQLEYILFAWYQVALEEAGYGAKYAPTITIIDSEQMSNAIKRDMVELLFSRLNCSYKTALELIGIDFEDEKSRRVYENDENFDDIFTPRKSQFTSGGDDGGRPPSDDPTNKTVYDKQRNQTE